MKSCVFILEGSVPSKKNQRMTFYKNGRVINIPSKKYQDWHEMCEKQLKALKAPSMNPPYEITLCFWMKDNRRTDLDNKVGSVLDLLQDAGVICLEGEVK